MRQNWTQEDTERTILAQSRMHMQVHAEARQEESRRAKIIFNEDAERAILAKTTLALQNGESLYESGDANSDSKSVTGGPVAPPGPGDPGKDPSLLALVDMKSFVLAEYVLDFGNVIKGQQVQKEFRVTNVGFSQVCTCVCVCVHVCARASRRTNAGQIDYHYRDVCMYLCIVSEVFARVCANRACVTVNAGYECWVFACMCTFLFMYLFFFFTGLLRIFKVVESYHGSVRIHNRAG